MILNCKSKFCYYYITKLFSNFLNKITKNELVKLCTCTLILFWWALTQLVLWIGNIPLRQDCIDTLNYKKSLSNFGGHSSLVFNLLQNGLILVVCDESDNRGNYQKYRSWWIILCRFCHSSWKMMPYQYCKCVVACRHVCCFVGIFHSTNQLMVFSWSPGAVDGFISSFIDTLQLGNLGCWFQGWNIHPMHDNIIYFDCF